ncbi:O-methyltransferase-domain-containing protein [Paraphysoderma sedebokerense]|nr:O-methyltransferase-domain-containing protein [Paraphysoderma sedebokerense]
MTSKIIQERQRILPPGPSILMYASAFMISKCLHVVTVLNIPDLLKNNPMSTKEIADKVKADPERLDRVMNLLYSHGIFKRNWGGKWSNNRMTSALRKDNPNSVKDLVEFFTDESYTGFEKLLEAVKDGSQPCAWDIQFGESFWTYLDKDENAWRRERFAGAMISQSNIVNKSLLVDFDWSRFEGKTICDVGGGFGGFSAELLRNNPSFRLILFDRPETAKDSANHWDKNHKDIVNRAEFVGGDFFKKVPGEADVYFLRTILHDWSDCECISILKTIHDSIPDSRKNEVTLLIADLEVVSPPNPLVSHIDLQMLATITGRERSRKEMNDLLNIAGFDVIDNMEARSGYLLTTARPKLS